MYAYFEEMLATRKSYTCCDRSADKSEKVIGQKYYKNDRGVYRKLIQYDDLGQAAVLAERSLRKCVGDGKKLLSEMWPAYMMQRLVAETLKKIS